MACLNNIDENQPTPSILSFAKDLPNLCSLAGLLSALLALYFAFLSLFSIAMIALIWAAFFDWSDGLIARNIKGRTKQKAQFGTQLDSLIDVVSFGICPAIILLSYGNFNPLFLPGAFIMVAAVVLRLSYFNIYDTGKQSTYQGMACDNNAIILVFVFLFEGLLTSELFTYLLYGTILTLAFLNIAPIQTPKLSGGWYYGLIAYTFFISLVYGWILVL